MAEPVEIAFNDGAAPRAYQLSSAEQLRLQSISATFDGSGAGGDFYPACSIYGPDGRLLSRTFPVEPMAAGDVSEVTFAPLL